MLEGIHPMLLQSRKAQVDRRREPLGVAVIQAKGIRKIEHVDRRALQGQQQAMELLQALLLTKDHGESIIPGHRYQRHSHAGQCHGLT